MKTRFVIGALMLLSPLGLAQEKVSQGVCNRLLMKYAESLVTTASLAIQVREAPSWVVDLKKQHADARAFNEKALKALKDAQCYTEEDSNKANELLYE